MPIKKIKRRLPDDTPGIVPDDPWINDTDEANMQTNEPGGYRSGRNDTTIAGKSEPSYEDTMKTNNQAEGSGQNETGGDEDNLDEEVDD